MKGNFYKQEIKNLRSKLDNDLNLKRAPTRSYNHKFYRRATTTFDLEKAHYEAELMMEEDESVNLYNQSMFQRKHISICKFYFHLFEGIDWLYFILGLIGCIIRGVAGPVMTYLNAIVFTNIGNTSEERTSLTAEQIMKLKVKDTMESNIKKQLVSGAVTFFGSVMAYFFFGLISTRCLRNLKKKYLEAILSQEQGWFDSTNVYEFASKIQAQLEYIELGMADQVVKNVVAVCTAIASLIFGFFGSWKLALVLLCLTPIIIVIGIFLNILNIKGNTLMRQAWEMAGGIAEEILYNIKTVASFANFEYELKRFYEKVEISNKIELRVNNITRFLAALLTFCNNLTIFIGYTYGRTLIKKDYNSFRGRDLTGGDVLLTYNCIVSFISSLSSIFNDIQYVELSVASSSDYFNICERQPQMDLSNSIEKPPLSNIRGNIQFNNVNFYYPSDPQEKMILNGINLNFESGKKIALIGESGCGKTTIVNLIERLYDVTGGEILLDGLDIRNYNIQYLRNLIGYVEQEPVLFNRTIRENIVFGREQYLQETGQDINQVIRNACDASYASEFIDKLPGGLDYVVGLKGSKLSGGQKQRIAIARAILIKPKILILDEPTSSLDNKSEKIVQKALDNISQSDITTIIIAHKLSTIRNADIIYSLKDGKFYEQGTHESLIQKGGYYAEIIRPQLIKEELDNQEKKDEYIRRMTTTKRANTDEEVQFERRDKEIAKTPDDVSMNYCNVIREAWNFKLDFILAILSAVCLGLLQIFEGIMMGKAQIGINSKYETVRYDKALKYAWIFLILAFVEIFALYVIRWKVCDLAINLAKVYRNKMMKKYLSFHLSYFDLDRNSPGSILTKMSIDTMQLKDYALSIVRNFLLFVAIMISELIIGPCYEYRLALIAFAFIPFILVIAFLRRLLSQRDSKKSIEAGIDGGGIVSECVVNSKIIFAYNFKPHAIRLYLESIDYITQQQVRDNLIDGFALGIIFFCQFLSNVAIFGATKHFILNDSMDSEDMSIIHTVITKAYGMISSIVADIGRIKKAHVCFKSIYSTLETESLIPPYYKDNINKLAAENIKGKIEFKHVYFAYPTHPEKVILKDISLTINPGEKVALVGYSGSGKSSVIQLLNRFYDVEDGKGEILIDDVNIKDYNLYELRKRIGFISQEPSMFKTSNIENIRYGDLNASDGECFEAAEKVHASYLLQNDKGNDLTNEKKGIKKAILSGGERQKLAMGRIILKKPQILLLDEATSALDKDSEKEIQKTLDELSNDKTTISIAHRLSTIENYDQIYVFDNGRIKEHGTHEELMKLQKRYYTLHKFSSFS